MASCNLISPPHVAPPPSPTATQTPTPSPSPTPEAEATPGENDSAVQAADEAEQKARQAAKKAAEAAAVAAEASAAAREAAKAAAKAVAASKSRGAARHPSPKASPRSSESTTPTPTETPSPGAEPTPGELGSTSVDRQEKVRGEIDQLSDRIKNIDRSRLGRDDSQRYDLAMGLLTSARTSLSRGDFMAAASLTEKAKVLIQGIEH